MPINKPKSRSKSTSKGKGKAVKQKKQPSKPKTTTRKSKKSQPPPPPARTPTSWEKLSIDRRLDVIGVVLALLGLLTLLSLISANRSALTGGLINFLGQIFGWGTYILPVGLIGIGIWLVLRNVERMPTFSIERITGVTLLYFWVLTVMHAVIATPELAEQAALDGVGGGYFGSLFERLLWPSLGSGGAIVAMIAWLLIGMALTLDVTILDLFKWLKPLGEGLREVLAHLVKKTASSSEDIDVQANGYTPLQRPPVPISVPQADDAQVGVPTTTVGGQPAIPLSLTSWMRAARQQSTRNSSNSARA